MTGNRRFPCSGTVEIVGKSPELRDDHDVEDADPQEERRRSPPRDGPAQRTAHVRDEEQGDAADEADRLTREANAPNAGTSASSSMAWPTMYALIAAPPA